MDLTVVHMYRPSPPSFSTPFHYFPLLLVIVGGCLLIRKKGAGIALDTEKNPGFYYSLLLKESGSPFQLMDLASYLGWQCQTGSPGKLAPSVVCENGVDFQRGSPGSSKI